jgi:hypothetical protein
MTAQIERSFTWKSLLVRLVVVPVIATIAVLVLVKLGDSSHLLQCWHTSTDDLCLVDLKFTVNGGSK